MRKFQSRWCVAQMLICFGVCCVVFAFASNFVRVVYAQNNMTVRINSPCITQATACRLVAGRCSTEGTYVYKGSFQCDVPKSGTTCTGTGTLAPCYDETFCLLDTGANSCLHDYLSNFNSEDKETKKEVPMAG